MSIMAPTDGINHAFGDNFSTTMDFHSNNQSRHDIPILVIVADNGTAALAISLPFSSILGLFSSMTSSSMVMKRFVRIYAFIQFLMVVFFAHLFYSFIHMQAAISIILATFAGFGVAMCANSIVIELLR